MLHIKSHPCIAMLLAFGVIGSTAFYEATMTQPRADPASDPMPYAQTGTKPREKASVYWVGHSLVEGKVQTSSGEIDLMRLVGRFAKEKGRDYKMGDHTLWGASMSALWRGRPYGYDRDASEMVPKREAFEKDAGAFDTLVVTEGIPLARSLDVEYSAYFLRRFACTLLGATPDARILLYQTWVHYQGSDPHAKYGPAHLYDWRKAMTEERKVWEKLADQASKPPVRAPGGLLSYIGISASSDGGCDRAFPVDIVPVGNAFLALDSRLAAPQPGDSFDMVDGVRITTGDLFANAYVDWPKDWPLAEGAKPPDLDQKLKALTRRVPSKDLDDIHLGELGIYVAALVHFASIYREPPFGLSHPEWLTPAAARTVECIAWETVTGDPRSGIEGTADC